MKYRIKEIDGTFYLQKRGWFKWKNHRRAIPSAHAGDSVAIMFNNYNDAISHLKMLSRPTLKPIIKYHYIGDDGYIFTEDFDRSIHSNQHNMVF